MHYSQHVRGVSRFVCNARASNAKRTCVPTYRLRFFTVAYLHVHDEGMLDFFEDGDFVAYVINLLKPDDVDHGQDFQSQRLAAMSTQYDSAKGPGSFV